MSNTKEIWTFEEFLEFLDKVEVHYNLDHDDVEVIREITKNAIKAGLKMVNSHYLVNSLHQGFLMIFHKAIKGNNDLSSLGMLIRSKPEEKKKVFGSSNLRISFYDRKTPPHVQFAKAFNILFTKSDKKCPRCGIEELELVIDYPKPGNLYFACQCGAILKIKEIELEIISISNGRS